MTRTAKKSHAIWAQYGEQVSITVPRRLPYGSETWSASGMTMPPAKRQRSAAREDEAFGGVRALNMRLCRRLTAGRWTKPSVV